MYLIAGGREDSGGGDSNEAVEAASEVMDEDVIGHDDTETDADTVVIRQSTGNNQPR